MYAKLYFSILAISFLSSKLNAQNFSDVAAQQGIIHSLNSTDNWGSGVSFYDFDHDGWDDLTLTQEHDSIVFYRNNQGNFELLPSFIYGSGETKQVLWVDYDNDNDDDLFVTYKFSTEKLYNNDGNFNFTDVSQQAGLYALPSPSQGVSFGDFNKDGYLDFYLCRYVEIGDSNDVSQINLLFSNNGDGTFTDKTFAAQLGNPIAPSFQGVWLDYDKDGWQDLFVINDKPYDANYLYHNNADGTFTDLADSAGVGLMANDPMSNTVGDFDNDNDLDIFFSNTGFVNSEGKLLVNNNNGTFNEMGMQYGVAVTEWSWGSVWLDYDNDGFQDLYVTTALVGNSIFPEVSSVFYKSNQALNFSDYTSTAFTGNHIAASYASAKGDINNDGYADIIVLNAKNYNSFLWQNSGYQNRYIKVTLHGTISNKMAIGSWVQVYAGGKEYTQYTICGEGYMSQNSQHLIFGIGASSIVDSLVVTYLSGVKDRYYNLSSNMYYSFTEGETHINYLSYSGNLSFCEGDSVILNAGNYQSYLWNNGSTQQNLTVTESGIYWVMSTSANGMVYLSDSIEVYVSQTPQISISAHDISCNNEGDGSISLAVTNIVSGSIITWNTGALGNNLNNLDAGTYTFTLVDSLGCSYSDSIQINEPYPLNFQTLVTPCYGNCNGSIQLMLNGGTAPYTLLSNGDTCSNYLDSLMFGNYLIEGYDANGCYIQITLQVPDSTNTGTQEYLEEFNCYPVPFTGSELQIISKLKIQDIEAYSPDGRLLASTFHINKLSINSSYAGIIYLKIKLKDVFYWKTVIKI